MVAWFDDLEFVFHTNRFKYWRLGRSLNCETFCGKSRAARKLAGVNFKTRQARNERAAIGTDKVVVLVIVDHCRELDGHA